MGLRKQGWKYLNWGYKYLLIRRVAFILSRVLGVHLSMSVHTPAAIPTYKIFS